MRLLTTLILLLVAMAGPAQAARMNGQIISASAVYVTVTTGTVSATNVYAKNISATTLSGNGSLLTSGMIGGLIYVSTNTFISLATSNTALGGNVTAITTGNNNDALFYFDVSQIPAGAVVHGASLNAFVAGTFLGDVGVFPITSSWSDGTVTWNTSPTIGAMLVSATVPANNALVSFDISSTMQAWLNGSLANNGLMLKQVSGTASGNLRGKNSTGAGMMTTLTVW